MSEESSSAPDLSSLGMDLAQSFAPAWAREETDQSAALERLAARHGGGEDRGFDDDRNRRRDDRRGRERPRKDRPEQRRDRDRAQKGDRRPGKGRQSDDRDRRPDRRAPRPEPKPDPTLQGWEIRYLPDRRGVDGLAKQIKSTAKAYPLFDLARLVLEKSERYHVEFRRTAPEAPDLWQAKLDRTLWPSEREAIAHILASGLDKYYRRERVQVDPPKGAFPCVAVCGMSGTLLGPPNYHDYQTKLVRLHQERFPNVPFETFKSRIKMEKDEELISKWREEQSYREVFYPLPPNPVDEAMSAEATPSPASEASDPSAVQAPSDAEVMPDENQEAAAEPTAAEESAPAAPTDDGASAIPPDESLAAEESYPPTEEADAETEAESTTEASADETVHEDLPRLETLADVERHFRENHAREVTTIRERVTVPGSAALNDSSPLVLNLTRAMWDELNRFPLPLAHTLGQQLSSKGLQIFKAGGNITFVGIARPRYLDLEATPISESLRSIMEFLGSHAKDSRGDQWTGLAAMRPPAEGQTEEERDAQVARDLSWLLHEGHVIDYVRQGLVVTPPPKNKPSQGSEAKPKKGTPAASTAETTGEATDTSESSPSAQASPAAEIATTQAADEVTPVADEAPVADETPVADESPVADETPVVDESPVADEAPFADEAPVADEAPFADEAVAAEEPDQDAEENIPTTTST